MPSGACRHALPCGGPGHGCLPGHDLAGGRSGVTCPVPAWR
ncbi:hypothetical protein HVPorG_04975 [Roseomonas mucosa]|nr:hypothetical protein HVPorG_04975 [Roseomonas mucosa]